MNTDLQSLLVTRDLSLLKVMSRINETARGFVLVVDDEGRLLDTVTDGDLRRAVLRGVDLGSPVHTLQKEGGPVTMPSSTRRERVMERLAELELRQIPLVDELGKVTDVVQLDDLFAREQKVSSAAAVIMAGGFGTRLMPLTANMPKPLLKIGDKPVMERSVERLRDAGISSFYVATHYKPEAFTEHFGNGDALGVRMSYVREESPLGTAGVLSKIPRTNEPLLVVNGDIVTSVNFKALFDFHADCAAEMTVCVRQYELNVPYGVVETEGDAIRGIKEKPTQRLLVNAGIYLLEPQVRDMVPEGGRFDMPDLIALLLAGKRKVVAFPIAEYWLDIGQVADFEQAQTDLADGKS